MLITNGTVIASDDSGKILGRILSDHAIYIQDGLIEEVAPTRDLTTKYPQEERLDARGQIVMPGNICAHTHFYGAYARGLAIPGEPPKDFPGILRRLWWNLDKALDKDSIRASALVSLVDAIKHGTTTLFDHHASPNFIEGSLDVIAEAVKQAGVRAVLCYEVTDRNGIEKAETGIAENLRFIEKYATDVHPLVQGIFGLHASMTLSDETLQKCVTANGDGFYHIHVAEHEFDQEDSYAKYKKRVVQRLESVGILNEISLLAHCVHVNKREIDLIADAGAMVTHQPRSNMNNAVGAMPLSAMLESGIKLGIGNDGFSGSMWDEWKATYFLHKVMHRDPRTASGNDIMEMAITNNNALAGTYFHEARGVTYGAAADLIFVDYRPFTPMTVENLPWHILFGFESSMITTTIVNGKVLMRDRQLLTLDEKAIAQEAMALAPGVWERYAKYAAQS